MKKVKRKIIQSKLTPAQRLFKLNEIQIKIENFAFEILAFTGSMLSLKKGCKINIYASGKIAIITKDLNQVKELATDLENVLSIKKK